MAQSEIEKIAENATIILAGYSFTPNDDGQIRILNLENPSEAAVLSQNGEMIETTMDDSKLALVQSYYLRNKEFLEKDDA